MSAFSNGTEFEQWREAWCDSCVQDFDTCPVLDVLLVEGEAPEIGQGPFWSPQTIAYCRNYAVKPLERTPPMKLPDLTAIPKARS